VDPLNVELSAHYEWNRYSILFDQHSFWIHLIGSIIVVTTKYWSEKWT
jgi:hypothetical protein